MLQNHEDAQRPNTTDAYAGQMKKFQVSSAAQSGVTAMRTARMIVAVCMRKRAHHPLILRAWRSAALLEARSHWRASSCGMERRPDR